MRLQVSFITQVLAVIVPFAAAACSSSDAGTPSQPQPQCGDPGVVCDDAAIDAANDSTDPQDGASEAAITPDAAPEANAPDAAQEAGPAPALDCSKIVSGLNDGFSIDGVNRAFLLDVPADAATAGPLPVVFNWHGLGDSAQNMRQLLSAQVNGPNYKFILVTPEDSAFKVSALGMSVVVDWDAFNADDANREVRLYDEVLSCLQTKYTVDAERVHCAGFSMGSIVCDMLGTLRGGALASVATYSGGYLNDPQNQDPMMSYVVNWPEYTVTNPYAQLFLHGGPTDTYSIGGYITIHFDQYAVHDSTYLGGKGHDNVLCNHGQGHSAPAGFAPANVAKFLSDHPRTAQQSPYRAGGLPSTFPAFCEFVAAPTN